MEKVTSANKFKQFCKEKKENLITIGIVLVLFNFMLAVNGCFPYGNSTVAMGDSLSQIGTFFGHIFNVFEGKSDLFYTNYLAGGVEVFSTIEYMLLNPFYLIAMLGGKNNVYLMLNFSVMFMFVFNALVFVWFAKKHFPSVKSYVKICFSVLFAFSPYAASNFFFVTWLIYPGILLILIDKFLNLVREGKFLGFVCTMVWYVCTCFSVGVSTNIILIVLFFAYIFFVKNKEERKPILVRLLVAYVVSILAAVVILFPALMAFINISSRTSLVETFFKVKYNNQTVSKIAFLILPAVFFVFAVYHLIKCNKKEGKNKFYIFAICFSSAVVLFGMITELLTGGKCNGLYFRFGFIYFVILSILLLEFFSADYKLEPKQENKFSLYKILLSVFTFICLFVFVLWVFLFSTKFTNGLRSIFVKSGFSWMTLFLIAMIVLFLISVVLMRKKGLISSQLFKGFIAFSMALSVCVNFVSVCVGIGSQYKYNDLRQAVATLDSNSKLKINNNNLTDRHINSLNLNLKNTSIFSSLTSRKMIESYESLGFLVSDVSVETANSHMLADSLFGQRYVASYSELNKPYLKLISSKGDYYIYENTLASTGAVVLEKDYFYDENLNVYHNYEKLKDSLGVSGTLFSQIELQKQQIEFDKRYGKFVTKYTYTASENTLLLINKKILTLDRDENQDLIEYFDKLIDLENVFYVEESSDVADSEMFYIEKGKSIEFCVAGVGNKSCSSDESIIFTELNYDVAEAVCKKLQERQVEVEYTKNGYKVNLNGQSGKLVVFNVDIDGMNYKVDGKSVEAGHEFGYFAAFEVDENTKLIKAYYKFPHSFSWIVLTILAVAIIFVIVILYKKTKFKFLEKFTYYAFFVASCCILVFFVGFGIFLTIFRIML